MSPTTTTTMAMAMAAVATALLAMAGCKDKPPQKVAPSEEARQEAAGTGAAGQGGAGATGPEAVKPAAGTDDPAMPKAAGNCPSTVGGAMTAAKTDEGKVVLTITAVSDPAAADTIRRRARALAANQAAAVEETAHTGEGTGGGSQGLCPMVIRNTRIAVTDVEGGVKVTMDPLPPTTLEELAADVEARQRRAAAWVEEHIAPRTPERGAGAGTGGGGGRHGGTHSGKGTGTGKQEGGDGSGTGGGTGGGARDGTGGGKAPPPAAGQQGGGNQM